MKVSVFYNYYYRHHKKMPRGVGDWIFSMPKGEVMFYDNMLFSEAKKLALIKAQETADFRNCSVAVMPQKTDYYFITLKTE